MGAKSERSTGISVLAPQAVHRAKQIILRADGLSKPACSIRLFGWNFPPMCHCLGSLGFAISREAIARDTTVTSCG